MRNILIYILLLALLALTACTRGNFALTHRADIQQGNVVTQEMMNQLTPGMTKRQVQLVMGTPTIVDVFQQDRWDYPYKFVPGRGPIEERKISLYFENDLLARTSGDLAPSETKAITDPTKKKVSVTVPYQDRGRRGVLTRLWRFLTFRNRDDIPKEQ